MEVRGLPGVGWIETDEGTPGEMGEGVIGAGDDEVVGIDTMGEEDLTVEDLLNLVLGDPILVEELRVE